MYNHLHGATFETKRKIIQITSMGPGYVLALCNDGTCWVGYGICLTPHEHGINIADYVWKKYDMDIPQPGEEDE